MFKGSLVAIVTPFCKDGSVDKKALKELVAWQVSEKTDAIVCCGTTGECTTLSEQEKLQVMRICVDVVEKKIPVIAGTGCNNTKKSFDFTKKAKELGVDGCLVIVPYYNRPSQEGCFLHFQEIAKANLPVIVYHHPGRTGIELSSEVFFRLSKIDNVVGIKDASCDLRTMDRIQEACNIPILSGDDGLTLSIMKKGGVGVISVVANIIPSKWKHLVDLCFENNYEKASSLLLECQDLIQAMSLEPNPQPVKYALSRLNRCAPNMRLPLIEVGVKTKETINALIR